MTKIPRHNGQLSSALPLDRTSMDVPRPFASAQRRRRRIATGVAVLLALAGITAGLSQLEPAAPRVDGSTVYIDTVKRGSMLRQVRGNGTLVPETIQFVQAETEGRVERILVQPGASVEPETVLMELSNPELQQAAFDAEWQIKAAEAQLVRLEVQLESERLAQESAAASLKADFVQAELEAEADHTLAQDGVVPPIIAKRSRSAAEQLKNQHEIELKRLEISARSAVAQLAVQRAELEKLRASHDLKKRQVSALHVRAGIAGVLQQIGDGATLQAGQRISPSATLAKIVQPSRLKAEIKVFETQARDVQIGQKASVDTRNGVIPGEVVRVDPAVQNGTVAVEIRLDGPLPRGARPDLSVEGTIELERLEDVLYVGKPVQGQPESSVSLFKLAPDGRHAERLAVKLGRSSVTTIEVLEGLHAGDRVILSDMASWGDHNRIRLK